MAYDFSLVAKESKDTELNLVAGDWPSVRKRRKPLIARLVASARPSTRAQSIVIGAALAHRAGFGGHAWALLQYVLGFRELGFDVTVVDRLEPGMTTDEDGGRSRAPGGLLGGEGIRLLRPR